MLATKFPHSCLLTSPTLSTTEEKIGRTGASEKISGLKKTGESLAKCYCGQKESTCGI